MSLPRPYIPFSVRIIVAARQCVERGIQFDESIDAYSDSRKINRMLRALFGPVRVHLDHDPALVNRKLDFATGKYTPDANDPNYLIYRTRENHDIKTRVRGDGAQHSDLGLRRKNKNIEANRSDRPKQKITQRKGFKWPKRPFNSRGVNR